MYHFTKCWAPQCNSFKGKDFNLNFYPLPRDPKFKETWLALTGRKVISEDQVFFCQTHFRQSSLEIAEGKVIGLKANALPFHHMPVMICRTCMCTISNNDLFCVISGKISSTAPTDLEVQDVVPLRPGPLYHILTFCIPTLNLEENPPSLICIKCYRNIWQYFAFKLKCNTIQQQLQGTLSAEEYGKLVLCRGCPATSGTDSFYLNEDQSMGQVLKKMFINNYPANIVPLRLCLKCWNILYKVTEFHENCIKLDQLIQRCADINRTQTLNNTPHPSIPPFTKGPGAGPMQHSMSLLNESASTSSSSNMMSPPKYSARKQELDAQSSGVIKAHIERIDEKLCVPVEPAGDPEMPRLERQVNVESEVSNAKMKCKSFVKNKFNHEIKLFLVSLMLKHCSALKPGLDPVERARADLEMWINVMKDVHEMGFTYTLETIQTVWSKMKMSVKTARKAVGPMTFLDFLVHVFLIRTSDSSDSDDSTGGAESELPDHLQNFYKKRALASTAINSVLQKANINIGRTSDVVDTIKLPNSANDLCDIITLDEDSDDDMSVEQNMKNVVRKSDTSPSNRHNAKRKRNSVVDTAPKEDLKAETKVRASKTPVKMLPRPRETVAPISNKKNKRNLRKTREIWNSQQKLQLVRQMRKVYNSLIEKGSLVSHKTTPWRNILDRLVANGFMNASSNKLYSMWSKMKISASTHEKNGLDIVDEEVWELLQLHADVQDSLSKKSSSSKLGDGYSGNSVNKSKSMSENKKSGSPTSVKKPNPKLPLDKKPRLSSNSIYEDSEVTHVSYENIKNDCETETKLVPNEPKVSSNPKQSNTLMSQREMWKILELIEKEFNRMLSTEGKITKSFTAVRDSINYKNLTYGMLMYYWRKLTVMTSDKKAANSPLVTKFFQLRDLYRRYTIVRAGRPSNSTKKNNSESTKNKPSVSCLPVKKSSKKPLRDKKQKSAANTVRDKSKTPSISNQKTKKSVTETEPKSMLNKRPKLSSNPINNTSNISPASCRNVEDSVTEIKPVVKRKEMSDQKKLDIISVIKTFGNIVFQNDKHSKRTELWNSVTEAVNAKGYKDTTSLEIRTLWTNMLRSAKKTWAQEDRTPRVGDREIIEFMTEVIKEKEKSRFDLSADRSDLSNNCEQNLNSDYSEEHNEEQVEILNDNVERETEVGNDAIFDSTEISGGSLFCNIEANEDFVSENTLVKDNITNKAVANDGVLNVPKSKDQEMMKKTQIRVEGDRKGTAGTSNFGAYDYVSFEDVKKFCASHTAERLKPVVVSGVVEIMESDEE